MSPKPQHGTPEGDATLAIQKLARQTGADVQELQTLYVLEALLARIAASVIRDTGEYAGIRVKLVGTLGRAHLTIGIDVNFGDPISPAPQLIELPRLVPLDQQSVILHGYPLTMVLAEKIVTAIDRGEANTRWRDFADVYALTRIHSLDAEELRASLDTVAAYRRVALTPLLPGLASMPERAQSKWRAWRTRMNREHDLPKQFAELLTTVSRFADPVLTQTAAGRWVPHAVAWDTDRGRDG